MKKTIFFINLDCKIKRDTQSIVIRLGALSEGHPTTALDLVCVRGEL